MAKIKSKTLCNICYCEISNNNYTKHINAHTLVTKEKQPRGHVLGKPAWNKGLTKNTDERVKKYGESISRLQRKKVEDGTFVPNIPGLEFRQKLSIQQSLHNRGGKSKWYEVAGQKVQGTYEKLFAEALTEQKIEWIKVKTHNHLFRYILDGKVKSYAPDFYLEEFDFYVELKGRWWGNDKEKMKAVIEQHLDKKIIIVEGLKQLKYVCNNIRTNLCPKLI